LLENKSDREGHLESGSSKADKKKHARLEHGAARGGMIGARTSSPDSIRRKGSELKTKSE